MAQLAAVPKRGRPISTPETDAVPMRERIKRAAVELFYERSYQLTTIRDISDACGITPGAIYNHFTSKDELLYTIILEEQNDFEREISGINVKWKHSPTDELFHLVFAYAKYHALHRHSALVANEYHRFLSKEFAPEILAQRRRLRQAFEAVLERGSDEGLFTLPAVKGKPSPRVAAIAIGDMSLRVAEWFRPGAGLAADEVAAIYARLALNMVSARRRRPTRRGLNAANAQ